MANLQEAETEHASTEASSNGHADPLQELRRAIEHAGHFLPAQGPITVFIHHNTLHAFEDLPFDAAVKHGAQVFGCQPYLSEERYRQELARGRIRDSDLVAVLRKDLGPRADETVLRFGTRLDLRLAMLRFTVWEAPTAELRWFVAETDALARFLPESPAPVRERLVAETKHWVMRNVRTTQVEGDDDSSPHADARIQKPLTELMDRFGRSTIERWSDSTWESFTLEALWRVCRDGVHAVKYLGPPAPRPVRHRDLLLEATGVDTDRLVNDLLTRLTSAFLDQGFSDWQLPNRCEGFLRSFQHAYGQAAGPPDLWLRNLPAELKRIEEAGLSPLELIHKLLEELGVPAAEWEVFITASLLSLRGWAGMLRQVEIRSDRVAHPIPQGSLIEFLAVRLILERLALASVAQDSLDFRKPLAELRDVLASVAGKREPLSVEQRAFVLFQLAQRLGWTPASLYGLSKKEWATLVHEIEEFPSLERRMIFHRAYERRYRNQTLDAVAIHARQRPERPAEGQRYLGFSPRKPPRFQVVTCLDEREESFRRHLEEVAPDVETFGAAGFFNVAMYYRGAADAHFVPLCPIVIRPRHWVEEDVVDALEGTDRRRRQARKVLGTASHQFHMGSRTFTFGALLATGLGILATVPLVARVLFPRLTARLTQMASQFVAPPPVSHLQLERSQPTAGPLEGQIGYSLEEMTDIGQRFLRDIGLTSGFSRLVLVLGHGSSSVNNPHRSAYDCGACGGNHGAPNARALAQILNDLRTRKGLGERGLEIPDDTVFVGGSHNTCNDSVTFSDLDRLPKDHLHDFEAARHSIELTCDRNAHERCRRFVSAPLTMTFPAARRHVENRSEDLAQTRPECGHATNSICYVGRRSRLRGLFMDRRTFLTSYDPTKDDEGAPILTRLMQACVPVCGGINLEYYFSYIDNPGWGCGTKLPHNVTSLLGIMDGAVSDLRPGLPWQMVEIHEPVRLLFILETTPEIILGVMERNPGIGGMIKNGWVQMSVLSPDSAQIHVYRDGAFVPYEPESEELPHVDSSVDWYRGWRDHLGYAVIDGGRA